MQSPTESYLYSKEVLPTCTYMWEEEYLTQQEIDTQVKQTKSDP